MFNSSVPAIYDRPLGCYKMLLMRVTPLLRTVTILACASLAMSQGMRLWLQALEEIEERRRAANAPGARFGIAPWRC
jgi:hypothetical protein